MKKRNLVMALILIMSGSSAFAQSRGGKGNIDDDYEQDVARYMSQLPNCPAPATVTVAGVEFTRDSSDVAPQTPDTSLSPFEAINKIAFVLKEARQDGETARRTHPHRAFLKPQAALEAITIATQYCEDLHSLLSRPIAEATLGVLYGLRDNIDASDEDSKTKELYDFAMASASVALDAALTLDHDYFGKYPAQYDPLCGFYCPGRPVPFPDEKPFSQKLFDIAANTLDLLNALGMNGLTEEDAYFHPYKGVTNAYLPAAQGIVTFVQENLKKNYGIFCKEGVYLDLKILKDYIDQVVGPGDSDIPTDIEKVHEDSDAIARRLRWWPEHRIHY